MFPAEPGCFISATFSFSFFPPCTVERRGGKLLSGGARWGYSELKVDYCEKSWTLRIGLFYTVYSLRYNELKNVTKISKIVHC